MNVYIIIDMQNDFIDGALKNEDAMKIVEPMCSFINKIKDMKNSYLVATQDTHQPSYLETNEGKHLPFVHCVENTRGWEINDEIKKCITNNAMIIRKPNFGISSENWAKYLKDLNPERIILMGVCTDICVVSNALSLKTAFPEIPVIVLSDLCAGVTIETHDAGLLTMKMCQVDLMLSKDIL